MSGKVIQALRNSPLATAISEAELRVLAGCGRIYQYAAGQTIVSFDGEDDRIFLLRSGKIDLHLIVNTETGQCSGEAQFELGSSGEPFGWAAWMQPDRVGISARALSPASVVAFDLNRLGVSEIFLKIGHRMLVLLYAHLQEYGICPPNVQALLKFRQLMQETGGP